MLGISQETINLLLQGVTNITWQSLVMIAISLVLMYLAIVKKFEPLLLLPIAFGMLLTNLPGAEMYHRELFASGHVDWAKLSDQGGLIDYLYLGIKLLRCSSILLIIASRGINICYFLISHTLGCSNLLNTFISYFFPSSAVIQDFWITEYLLSSPLFKISLM